jgi:hypothetical protein
MIALGADVEIVSKVGVIQHRVAGRALAPQPLGHDFFFAAFLTLYLGREKFLKPAHRFAVNDSDSSGHAGNRTFIR